MSKEIEFGERELSGGYARLILFKEPIYKQGNWEIVLQRLKSGRLVFPGGKIGEQDGDPLEALVRELGEESGLSKGSLRQLRVTDLIYGANYFVCEWNYKGSMVGDYCFVLPYYSGLKQIFEVADEEIVATNWYPVRRVVSGNLAGVYENIRRDAWVATSYMPILLDEWKENGYL